jgi:hypothetical protein
MAEQKYAKNFTKMPLGPESACPPYFKGKITRGPLLYDKNFDKSAPIHMEIYTIYKAGAGFGMGTSWVGDAFGEKIPDNSSMKHEADELFIYHGCNPDDAQDLGGEIEFWIGEGKDAEQHIITEPTVVYVPAGLVHMPEYYRKVTRPFFKIVLMLQPEWTKTTWVPLPEAFKIPPQYR